MTIICNFDGFVGCTHNYAGLSAGNIASIQHKNTISNPQKAALQGLEQMTLTLNIVGIQGFLPPHIRPNFEFLYQHGFGTNESKALEKAYTQKPHILAAAWSASAMWAANAATVTQTDNNHLHITPANLQTMPHRHQELAQTQKNLQKILYHPDYVTHHVPQDLPDEGTANYMPLRGEDKNYDIFVFSPKKASYPARQSEQSSRQIAKNHGCKNPVFLEQSVLAVNMGAFHNDVVAISHDNFIIYHEDAFVNDDLLPHDILKIKIPNSLLPLSEAIKTYLFNMRIITNEQGDFEIIASSDCCESSTALRTFDFIQEMNPRIKKIHFLDLRQSMANGGGSACLRLRVPIINNDFIHPAYLLKQTTINDLGIFVKSHYRDRLHFEDLQDIDFAYSALGIHQKLNNLIETF